MVQPDVEDDRDARVEAEEGILVFAGFKNEIAVASDAVSRADGRQRRADEKICAVIPEVVDLPCVPATPMEFG